MYFVAGHDFYYNVVFPFQGWRIGGIGIGYGSASCPIDLLYSLSQIVSTLHGYGQTSSWGSAWGGLTRGPSGYTAMSGGLGYPGYASPMSSGFSGFQAGAGTANAFNPSCPWPLINGMIAQIQQYVNQMQAVEAGGTPAQAVPYAARGGMMSGSPYGMMGGSGLMGGFGMRPMKK